MCNIVLGVSKDSCVVVPKAAGIGLGLLSSFPRSDASGTVGVCAIKIGALYSWKNSKLLNHPSPCGPQMASSSV